VSAPEFYRNSVEEVERVLDGLKKAEVSEIGRSAGGRPLYAVAYGTKERVERTANLSSALAGRKPGAFFGEGREKQVALVVSAVHGAEMESIAGVLNLFSVIETGTDRKGTPWETLAELAEGVRLVVVPIGNPDGRARIPSDDPITWSHEEVEKYRHGLWKDGSQITWPACKNWHPMPADEVGFMGGYFSDAGVNPSHGLFLPREVAVETHAILDLVADETPDLYLDLHSCGAGPFFIPGQPMLPELFRLRSYYIEGVCVTMLREHGLRPKARSRPSDASVIDLYTAAYHVAGSMCMLFEGAHGGAKSNRYTHAEIVDTYLTVFEGILTVGVRETFKAGG